MTKRIDRLNQWDPLTCDALAWVVRLKSGEATLEDAEQMINWRTQSPAHERAFRDAVKCWKAIGCALVGDRSARPDRRRKTTKSKSIRGTSTKGTSLS